MQYRKLGANGPEVSALGLGTMGLSPGLYGEVDDEESVATINRALDLGINLIDTANVYDGGANEELVGRAIRGAARRRRSPPSSASPPTSPAPWPPMAARSTSASS